MHYTRLIGWFVLLGVACAAGCGDGQTPPLSGGDGLSGLATPTAKDLGIIQDVTTYKPAPLPTGGGAPGGSVASVTPGQGSDPGAAVRELGVFISNAIRDGDADLAMRAFDPQQVAALSGDQLDPIFATLELVNSIAGRLDESKASALLAGLRGAPSDQIKADPLDASNASLSPNVARVLLGPAATGDVLKAKSTPAGWKIDLGKTLAEADVTAIREFHTQLQASLERIREWVRNAQKVDEAALTKAATAALAGQPVELPASEGGQQP